MPGSAISGSGSISRISLIRRSGSTFNKNAHRLRIAAPVNISPLAAHRDGLGLIARQREDVQVGDNPSERIGIDVVGRAGGPVLADELPCPPQAGVRI